MPLWEAVWYGPGSVCSLFFTAVPLLYPGERCPGWRPFLCEYMMHPFILFMWVHDPLPGIHQCIPPFFTCRWTSVWRCSACWPSSIPSLFTCTVDVRLPSEPKTKPRLRSCQMTDHSHVTVKLSVSIWMKFCCLCGWPSEHPQIYLSVPDLRYTWHLFTAISRSPKAS